jgi:DNA-binding MarR family transcriptional regulator
VDYVTPIQIKEIKESMLIAEDKIPVRMTTRSEEWATFLKKIPQGQALATTRKELGVTASSIKSTIDRLIKNGQITPTYYIRQHKAKDGADKIYIVNSIHTLTKRKRSTTKISDRF